jgi:N-acylneuraminate cytidylyltransferase
MKRVAFIFARGGSKGLPGKNIRPLAGKPLIAWSIEHALAVSSIDSVIVSTDSLEIAKVAREYGAAVPFLRPAELSGDDSSEWLAWRHALCYVRETTGLFPEALISVPTTAPLRSPIDIENCLKEYDKGISDVVIAITDSHRNPYFNMVKTRLDGSVELVNSSQLSIERRQDAPPVYDITTVCYVARPDFVMARNSIFDGRVNAVHVPIERSIDIDTLFDFKIAESLLRSKKGMQ